MPSEQAANIWAKLKSAEIIESQGRRMTASPAVHIEHVHGDFFNLAIPPGATLSEVLEELNTIKAK